MTSAESGPLKRPARWELYVRDTEHPLLAQWIEGNRYQASSFLKDYLETQLAAGELPMNLKTEPSSPRRQQRRRAAGRAIAVGKDGANGASSRRLQADHTSVEHSGNQDRAGQGPPGSLGALSAPGLGERSDSGAAAHRQRPDDLANPGESAQLDSHGVPPAATSRGPGSTEHESPQRSDSQNHTALASNKPSPEQRSESTLSDPASDSMARGPDWRQKIRNALIQNESVIGNDDN